MADDAYSSAGVDYDVLDAVKRLALSEARATDRVAAHRGMRIFEASRGGSAFVFELGGQTLAFVVEGLGTKAVLAREHMEASGEDRFGDVAYDTVAAIVNDLASVRALPLVVNAYFSTGDAAWYADEDRASSLVRGWRRACEDAGAAWGGGESPALPGVVSPDEIELAGSAVGIVPEGLPPLFGEEIEPDDEIVLMASTGIHANGVSLARRIAAEAGLMHELPSGETLGSALLTPAPVYTGVIEALCESRAPLTGLANITGHGLRKVMRSPRDLTYRLTTLPPVPESLSALAELGGLDDRAAYGTFNMGAGYAAFCRPGAGADVVAASESAGIPALVAGAVEHGPRRVIAEPLGLEYGGEELQLD